MNDNDLYSGGVDDPETVVIDPETVVVDPETVVVDPETVVVDPETVVVDPETVVVDPETVVVDPETVVVDPETVVVDPETVVVDPETGGGSEPFLDSGTLYRTLARGNDPNAGGGSDPIPLPDPSEPIVVDLGDGQSLDISLDNENDLVNVALDLDLSAFDVFADDDLFSTEPLPEDDLALFGPDPSTAPQDGYTLETRAESIKVFTPGNAVRRGELDTVQIGKAEGIVDIVSGTETATITGKLREHNGRNLTHMASRMETTVGGRMSITSKFEDSILLGGAMTDTWSGATMIGAAMSDDMSVVAGVRVTAPVDLWLNSLTGMEERPGTVAADGVFVEACGTLFEREYGPSAYAVGTGTWTGTTYLTTKAGFRPLMRVAMGVRNLVPGAGAAAEEQAPPPASGAEGAMVAGGAVMGGAGVARGAVNVGTSVDNMIDAFRAGEAAADVTSAHNAADLRHAADTATQVEDLRTGAATARQQSKMDMLADWAEASSTAHTLSRHTEADDPRRAAALGEVSDSLEVARSRVIRGEDPRPELLAKAAELEQLGYTDEAAVLRKTADSYDEYVGAGVSIRPAAELPPETHVSAENGIEPSYATAGNEEVVPLNEEAYAVVPLNEEAYAVVPLADAGTGGTTPSAVTPSAVPNSNPVDSRVVDAKWRLGRGWTFEENVLLQSADNLDGGTGSLRSGGEAADAKRDAASRLATARQAADQGKDPRPQLLAAADHLDSFGYSDEAATLRRAAEEYSEFLGSMRRLTPDGELPAGVLDYHRSIGDVGDASSGIYDEVGAPGTGVTLMEGDPHTNALMDSMDTSDPVFGRLNESILKKLSEAEAAAAAGDEVRRARLMDDVDTLKSLKLSMIEDPEFNSGTIPQNLGGTSDAADGPMSGEAANMFEEAERIEAYNPEAAESLRTQARRLDMESARPPQAQNSGFGDGISWSDDIADMIQEANRIQLDNPERAEALRDTAGRLELAGIDLAGGRDPRAGLLDSANRLDEYGFSDEATRLRLAGGQYSQLLVGYRTADVLDTDMMINPNTFDNFFDDPPVVRGGSDPFGEADVVPAYPGLQDEMGRPTHEGVETAILDDLSVSPVEEMLPSYSDLFSLGEDSSTTAGRLEMPEVRPLDTEPPPPSYSDLMARGNDLPVPAEPVDITVLRVPDPEIDDSRHLVAIEPEQALGAGEDAAGVGRQAETGTGALGSAPGGEVVSGRPDIGQELGGAESVVQPQVDEGGARWEVGSESRNLEPDTGEYRTEGSYADVSHRGDTVQDGAADGTGTAQATPPDTQAVVGAMPGTWADDGSYQSLSDARAEAMEQPQWREWFAQVDETGSQSTSDWADLHEQVDSAYYKARRDCDWNAMIAYGSELNGMHGELKQALIDVAGYSEDAANAMPDAMKAYEALAIAVDQAGKADDWAAVLRIGGFLDAFDLRTQDTLADLASRADEFESSRTSLSAPLDSHVNRQKLLDELTSRRDLAMARAEEAMAGGDLDAIRVANDEMTYFEQMRLAVVDGRNPLGESNGQVVYLKSVDKNEQARLYTQFQGELESLLSDPAYHYSAEEMGAFSYAPSSVLRPDLSGRSEPTRTITYTQGAADHIDMRSFLRAEVDDSGGAAAHGEVGVGANAGAYEAGREMVNGQVGSADFVRAPAEQPTWVEGAELKSIPDNSDYLDSVLRRGLPWETPKRRVVGPLDSDEMVELKRTFRPSTRKSPNSPTRQPGFGRTASAPGDFPFSVREQLLNSLMQGQHIDPETSRALQTEFVQTRSQRFSTAASKSDWQKMAMLLRDLEMTHPATSAQAPAFASSLDAKTMGKLFDLFESSATLA